MELSEFILQKYSRDYYLQIPKLGFEVQYREWDRKRKLLHELIDWLDTDVLDWDD